MFFLIFHIQNGSWELKIIAEKKKNEEICGWSAILNASGAEMANHDNLLPSLHSLTHRCFLHKSPGHQWNATYSFLSPTHEHHKQKQKQSLIN